MITASKHDAMPVFAADIDRPIVNAAGGSVRHIVVTIRTPQREPDGTGDRIQSTSDSSSMLRARWRGDRSPLPSPPRSTWWPRFPKATT